MLVREQLSLPPGLFLNVATTVLSVCNLSRNRHHLTRTLSKEKSLFQEFPLFTGVAFGDHFQPKDTCGCWRSAQWAQCCRSGREQHLPEHRWLHSGSGRGQHKPTLTKPKVCAGQDREFSQGQLEPIQHGPAVWTSLPPWSVRLACSLCLHLITHAESNHLSGNSSVNSSFVLQWQVLLSSNQPGHTHYIWEKGKNLHNYKTSPAFFPLLQSSSFFGRCTAFAENASAFPIPHLMYWVIFYISCEVLLHYVQASETASGKCVSQQRPGSLGQCLWWAVHLPTARNSCLPRREEPHLLSSVSLCKCLTMPRKMSSGPLILGNPETLLCLQGWIRFGVESESGISCLCKTM